MDRIRSNGGSDGARTRDLRRDRPTIFLIDLSSVPTFIGPDGAGLQADVGTISTPTTTIHEEKCPAAGGTTRQAPQQEFLHERTYAPPPVDVSALRRALDQASTPPDVLELENKLDAAERYMRDSGLYTADEIRPINETRMFARWKLGRLLTEVDRGAGPGRGKEGGRRPSFKEYIKTIGLAETAAKEAQRIGTLPELELEKAFSAAHKQDDFLTYTDLIKHARPYWYKASRQKRHAVIVANAAAVAGDIGPFPLIYADPPWQFKIYSEKGLERTPDQHYPTLTDDEIKDFRVGGKRVRDLAHRDAALLMWCTSSNLERALGILDAWGFTFKSSAVWVKLGPEGKPISGLGFVFRNMHEILLYGTRGNMPGPQYQPPSVFMYPRGDHSAKPPEIRTEIEKMYPDFDAKTRAELFSRECAAGWTSYGFEAGAEAAPAKPSNSNYAEDN